MLRTAEDGVIVWRRGVEETTFGRFVDYVYCKDYVPAAPTPLEDVDDSEAGDDGEATDDTELMGHDQSMDDEYIPDDDETIIDGEEGENHDMMDDDETIDLEELRTTGDPTDGGSGTNGGTNHGINDVSNNDANNHGTNHGPSPAELDNAHPDTAVTVQEPADMVP
ncbi:hypothetical protein DL546_004991 [Coniochaeta pulveracea]|uniref:Uncharacterized protein n=1 Tax=Coniochaeta pulveracea TaxID=177199 RepID=A0A420Y306_9PEZI|nr:hypothetical protein DL546_004991 [Coniochaeta pulveracea]